MKRYLIYAFGEILLVVVGILLALQINNWNIESKERESEKYYLSQIVHDLTLDKNSLTDLKSKINSKLPRIESLLNELHQEINISTFKVEFQDYIDNVWSFNNFICNSTTYEEMKSSGKLGLIKNKELRNDIMKFYNDISLFETVVQENNNWLSTIDADITHNKGLAKFLSVQSPMFSKYITENDLKEVLKLKSDLINNAATQHWAIKDLTPHIEAQLIKIDQMKHKIQDSNN
jgi:hypothetical protein